MTSTSTATQPGPREPFRVLIQRRCEEYAARLPPIEDLNLPPTLRPFSEGKTPSLHLGFQCPWPDTTGSGKTFATDVGDRLRWANNEVDAVFGPRVLDWRLVHVPTVSDRALSSKIIVVAFYINVHEKLEGDDQTRKKMRRVRKALREAFGEGVEGPKWYWDATVHGAEAHSYKYFDEAYPSGFPIPSATDS